MITMQSGKLGQKLQNNNGNVDIGQCNVKKKNNAGTRDAL